MENLTVQYYDEGLDFANLGQCSEAVAPFDRAIAINPDYTGAKQIGKLH
jgi:hypothetical protein